MTEVHYRILISGREPENIYVVKCDDEVTISRDGDLLQEHSEPDIVVNVTVDGLVCSLYFNVLEDEGTRERLLTYLWETHEKKRVLVSVNVVEPKKNVLDWKGNEMFERSALERREADRALAWFSTLGGAFSALGDSMADCAIVAGKISTRQFKLALKLGDPTLLARSRLYMALSLIQQRDFKSAKTIIRNEYHLAIKQIVKDAKLISMCRGIWAKLKYETSRQTSKCLPAIEK